MLKQRVSRPASFMDGEIRISRLLVSRSHVHVEYGKYPDLISWRWEQEFSCEYAQETVSGLTCKRILLVEAISLCGKKFPGWFENWPNCGSGYHCPPYGVAP